VTGRVESLIIENRLQPGDRLPAERDLAGQFGVSRTVIREAVRSLTAKGMLEVRPGSGTLVCTPSVESVTQSMTLFLRGGQPELDHKKVMEVRRLLEVEIAGLAAERRTEQDLAAMEAILKDINGIHQKRERFVEWDMAFHSALAAATHNELFSLVLDSVVATMIKVREIGFDIPSSPDHAIKLHGAIFKQVKRNDAEAARQAMRDHLIESEGTMVRALALRAAKTAKRRV
jgi:GntR family transcriptional regulator, transcriptional repressor for pyruvate dehydrogenase complex